RRVLCFVEVRAYLMDVRAEGAQQCELRLARALGDEDGRAHAEAVGRPRSRRALVPCRCGDDVLLPLLENGERAAPLERADLVGVLAVEEDVTIPELERRRHRIETTLGRMHADTTLAARARRIELSPARFRRIA